MPLTVQLLSASVPELFTPPPSLAAELPLTVQLVSVSVPELFTPPPTVAELPPLIVSPEMDAVTSPSTWNTRLSPPPLTVTPAFGPVMVSVSLVLLSSSWVPVRVIVCGVLNTVLSKVIFEFPELSASAKRMASGRLKRPAPGKRVALVVFTIREAKTGPVFVRAKVAGDVPLADATTWYDPSMLLGATVAAAWPPAMTAEEANTIAVAPLVARWATNVTTPPFTGSTGLLALTVTASGLAKSVPMFTVWGVLPATSVRPVKPWLSKAPMSMAPTRPRPRWSVAGMPAPLLPALIAGLPGSKATVWVGPP